MKRVWSLFGSIVIAACCPEEGRAGKALYETDPALREALHCRQVWAGLAENRFVLRTDVISYYASIDHFLLLDQLAEIIRDKRVLNLLGQYLRRTAKRGGVFWDYEKGISLGCPLSPLIGALFLKCLNERMEKSGLCLMSASWTTSWCSALRPRSGSPDGSDSRGNQTPSRSAR